MTAADQKASFGDQMAKAKLAAGDMKSAFDKLILDNTDQIAAFDSHMAQAEHDAARQQVGFDIRMAKAEHDAGGMKVGFSVLFLLWYVALLDCGSDPCTPSSLSGGL